MVTLHLFQSKTSQDSSFIQSGIRLSIKKKHRITFGYIIFPLSPLLAPRAIAKDNDPAKPCPQPEFIASNLQITKNKDKYYIFDKFH